MKAKTIYEFAILSSIPCSTKQQEAAIIRFATMLAEEGKRERAAKVVKDRGLSLKEWMVSEFSNPQDYITWLQIPESVIGDSLASIWRERRGSEEKSEEKMWSNWSKFYNYFTSADAKKPRKKDWPKAWINFITKG